MLNHKNEFIWVLLLTLILNFFSYYPLIHNLRTAPPDRYYWGGSTEVPLDALGNVDTIRRGYLGDWYHTPPDTSTIRTIPTALKFEYILIGHIGRIAHIDPLIMYYLSKIILSTATILVIYGVIRSVFATPAERFVCFLTALFATSVIFPVPWSRQILTFLPLEVSVFFRLTTAPHHYLLGILLSLASMYFFAKALDDRRQIRYVLISVVSGLACGIINAPSILLVLVTLPVFFLLRLTQYPAKKILTNDVPLLCFYCAGVGLSFVYLTFMSHFWNYNTLAYTEQRVGYKIVPWQYIWVVGVPYILALCAVPYVLAKKQTFLTLCLPWIILHPLAIFLITPVLHMNNSRLFFSAYFVVFAILATAGLSYLTSLARRSIHIKNLTFWIFLTATIVTIGSGVCAYQRSFRFLFVDYLVAEPFTFGYPKKDVMDAVWWLRDHTQKNDIVLSDLYAGALIPAFAGNKVFTSWWFYLESPEFGRTYTQVLDFYSRAMSDTRADTFLRSNSISYVVVRFEEQLLLTPVRGLSYPSLQEKFHNDTAAVYKVK